jgi:hypothetical protein
MKRLRLLLCIAFLAGIVSGCGDDSNSGAQAPQDTGPEFAQKTADMMKAANTGMDLSKAQKKPAAPSK